MMFDFRPLIAVVCILAALALLVAFGLGALAGAFL
jgi:hypothetical protein